MPSHYTPVISFEPQAVVANGVAPGGQVVWFSVAREVAPDAWTTVVPREARMLASTTPSTTGPGSQARYVLDRPVPLRSIWVAVDYATVGVGYATPPGFPLRLVKWRGTGPIRQLTGPDLIQDRRRIGEILLVRPGVGAWRATVGDGSPEDLDGRADGQFTASLANMRLVAVYPPLPPLPAVPSPPVKFMTGDLLVLIDPSLLEITVSQIADQEYCVGTCPP